jgi:histidine triad (HIT) family protein
MGDCLFCRIVQGEIPARKVHEDDHVLAFHDVSPRAPTHILVIPKRHIASLDATIPGDAELLGRVLVAVADVARALGVADRGYRTVLNTNAEAGQTVFHLHAHLLAGRPLGWPPG